VAGAVLVSSPPFEPGVRIGGAACWFDDQAGEHPLEFVAGERDQPGRWRCSGVFVGGENGE
jgi:hypothetical protein